MTLEEAFEDEKRISRSVFLDWGGQERCGNLMRLSTEKYALFLVGQDTTNLVAHLAHLDEVDARLILAGARPFLTHRSKTHDT